MFGREQGNRNMKLPDCVYVQSLNFNWNIKILHISHHSWRYSPWWALASSTIRLHFTLSCIVSIHCFILIAIRSATTSSIHLFPGINIVLTFQVAIVKSDFQTPFINVCFSSLRGWLLGFETSYFYGEGLSAPRPNPNLEDQGIPFRLGHRPWPVWHGRSSYISLCNKLHEIMLIFRVKFCPHLHAVKDKVHCRTGHEGPVGE